MKYTIVNTCQDVLSNERVSGKYLEKGTALKQFDSKREAFNFAVKAAEEEVEFLMDDCDEGISFGIPEDNEYERMESVKVCYYNHENDVTELVTEYSLFEMEQNLIPGKFYDLDGDLLNETPNTDEVCITLAKMSLIGNYPDLDIMNENGNLDNDVVMAVARELKNQRYAFFDTVFDIVDDFMCERSAEQDERDEI